MKNSKTSNNKCNSKRTRVVGGAFFFVAYFSVAYFFVRRDGGSCVDSGYSQHMWNYDKIAANEAMAEAFRAFANRALCQESVWFLEEVSRWVETLVV